ncbi:hypothetical protein D9615_005282 [Tricholomella constricta]|uniref:Transmembrane protein n=1 Tax=Tricholomella constricta TaxID=117010 RepID=A0A8H5H6W4_9AGAR|nr:hypothetical protein D9615_005282 [Tricholomella constricta]
MSNAGLSPISLTLSDDSAIESILTDIPFFCVGLMAFGVFTFVLVLKRVSLIAIYLYASSFLAFAAAIFDLGDILARGRTGQDTASGLVTVREVGFALSLGFNFVFLWHLVAKCPRKERHQSPDDVNSDANSAYVHSASWRRWGVIGLLLQWSLLGLAVSIPILQIIWRISPPDIRFGPVYVAEATIEVVVSALFILKIFLNIFLSPVTPWWRPIQSNLAPLFALSISTSLGLGNLVALAFSETTLGRFLRAVEMYILILFVLITAFYEVSPKSISTLSDQGKSFIRISEKPQPPMPRVNSPLHPNSGIISRRRSVVPAYNETRRPSMGTSLSRLSSWVLPQNSEQRRSAERIYIEDRELGMAPADISFSRAESTSRDIKEAQKVTISIDMNLASDKTNPEKQSAIAKDRPWTAVSIPSYYGMEQFSAAQTLPPPPGIVARDTDSPVYGLNGIMTRSQEQGKLSRPHSSISFDELLRQQTELDQSIAALRLFSSETTSAPDMLSPQPPATAPLPSKASGSPKTRSNSVSTNSYLGRKPDSASNRSDFSLSIFPEPPAVKSAALPVSTKLERLVGRARMLRGESTEAAEAVPIKVTGEDFLSLPVSPTQFEETSRFQSAGTQYDVTSFIGGLTLPIRGSSLTTGSELAPVTGTGLATAGTTLSDVESVDERPPQVIPNIVTATQAVIRPMILASSTVLASPVTTGVVPSSSTERPREINTLRRDPSLPLRPFLLGTSSQAIPVMLPSSTMIPLGSRRKGLPSNPRRPTISGPSLPADDGRGDQAPGAFERPRPPPLLLPK